MVGNAVATMVASIAAMNIAMMSAARTRGRCVCLRCVAETMVGSGESYGIVARADRPPVPDDPRQPDPPGNFELTRNSAQTPLGSRAYRGEGHPMNEAYEDLVTIFPAPTLDLRRRGEKTAPLNCLYPVGPY